MSTNMTIAPLYNYNVVEVRINPGYGQYATIEEAVDYVIAQVPDANNRWLVDIGVGEFTADDITIPQYTSVRGSTIGQTVIVPSGNNGCFLLPNSNVELSFLNISDVPTGEVAVLIEDCGDFVQMHKVSFVDCDTSVDVSATAASSIVYLEYVDISGTYTYGVKSASSGGFDSIVHAENFYVFSSAPNSTGVFVTGATTKSFFMSFGIYGADHPFAPPLAGTTGIIAQGGSETELQGGTFGSNALGVHNPNIGGFVAIDLNAVNMESNTFDLLIQHPNTVGSLIGSSTIPAISIPSTSTFTTTVSMPHGNTGLGQNGTMITGPLHVGDTNSDVCNVTTLIYNMGVGHISGGEITDEGGLDISVAAGVGYGIDTGVLLYFNWAATVADITLTDNATNYVYVRDLAGVPTITASPVKPNKFETVLLGTIRTVAGDIVFIMPNYYHLAQANITADERDRDLFGSLYEFGSIVTEGTSMKLDVSNGEYYYGHRKFEPAGGADITFDFYTDLIAGWTITTTDTVPATYTNAGVQDPIPNNKWARHALYLSGDGVYEKYMMVSGTTLWNSAALALAAPLPTPPSYFEDGVVLVASIVVAVDGVGAATIDTIQSERPFPANAAAAVATPTAHSALTGLTTGNAGHTQFLMLDGTTAMAGDLDMDGWDINNLNDITSSNSITVSTGIYGAALGFSLTDGGVPEGKLELVSTAASANIVLEQGSIYGYDVAFERQINLYSNLSDNRVVDFPDNSGTVAFTSDISSIASYFFYKTNSDIGGYYKMLTTPASGLAQTITIPGAAGTGTIASFATEPGVPNKTFIPSGWFRTHIHANTVGAGNVTLYAEVYKRVGGVETLLVTTESTSNLTALLTEYNIAGYLPALEVINTTDRYVYKLKYVVASGTPDIVFTFENGYQCRMEAPATQQDLSGYLTSATAAATYQPIGSYQASNANLTSLSGLAYVSAAFVKMTAANTFTLDTNTYSLSSHNHAGVYEPVITAGTTAQYWRGDKTWQTLPTAIGMYRYGASVNIGTGVGPVFFQHDGSAPTATDSIAAGTRQLVPKAGTLTNLYVEITTLPGGTATRTFTVYKNGVATTLTCTITAGVVIANDTVNTVAVAAGDTLSVGLTNTNSPANSDGAIISFLLV